MRGISRDHSRTNRNGLKLDYLDAVGRRHVPSIDGSDYQTGGNPFKKERRSPGGQISKLDGPRSIRPMTPREKPMVTKFDLM